MTVEVNIPEAKDLIFQKISTDNPYNKPVLRCHFCGKKTNPDANWMFTMFAPIKDLPDVAVMFFVCSEECKDKLCSHPLSNTYLFIAVNEAMKSLGFHTPGATSDN